MKQIKIGLTMVFVVLIALLSSAVLAIETYISIDFDVDDEIRISSIRAEQRNAFYSLFTVYPEDPYFDIGKTVQLLDGNSNVVYSSDFSSPWFAPYERSASKVRVVSDAGVLVERSVVFCNNNGICEPCKGPDCNIFENSLTCSDCDSGSADLYCDLARDGVCDPDCNDVDGDCDLCSPYCFFADQEDFTCAAISGQKCDPVQDCLGGYFVYAEDAADETCCLQGVCRNLGEYVETTAQLENQPSLTITPEGEFASIVQEQGPIEDYCIEELKGIICAEDEFCSGEETEYYHDVFCCIGECIIYKEETNITAPIDYLAEIYEEPPEEVKEIPEEIEEFPEEEIEPELPTEELPIIPEEEPTLLERIDLFYASIFLVGILAIVFFFVIGFKTSASRKMKAEAKPAALDLQSQIDALVARGNNYKQIEQILLQKGFERSVVDIQIRKNYQNRLKLQRMKR
jgi:hypothetical protein